MKEKDGATIFNIVMIVSISERFMFMCFQDIRMNLGDLVPCATKKMWYQVSAVLEVVLLGNLLYY